MEVTTVENGIGKVGSHKIGSDDTTIRKNRTWQFQRVKFGVIEYAIGKTDVEQQRVDHSEIDIGKIASDKRRTS